jgi:hypothetical protein
MMDSLLASRAHWKSVDSDALAALGAGQRALVDFGDEVGIRAANTERMNFHTPANLTVPTPRLSRD